MQPPRSSDRSKAERPAENWLWLRSCGLSAARRAIAAASATSCMHNTHVRKRERNTRPIPTICPRAIACKCLFTWPHLHGSRRIVLCGGTLQKSQHDKTFEVVWGGGLVFSHIHTIMPWHRTSWSQSARHERIISVSSMHSHHRLELCVNHFYYIDSYRTLRRSNSRTGMCWLFFE